MQWAVQFTADCRLLTADYRLATAHCPLPTGHSHSNALRTAAAGPWANLRKARCSMGLTRSNGNCILAATWAKVCSAYGPKPNRRATTWRSIFGIALFEW